MSVLLFVLVLFRLVRALSELRPKNQDSNQGRDQSTTPLALLWVALLCLAGIMALSIAGGALWLTPALAALVVLLMPWTVARWILIPLGMPRAASWLSSLSIRGWSSDRTGAGLVAGAWAVLRQAEPDRAAIEQLERLRDAQPRLQASHVLATGLLAAARGDLDSARALLESVDELGPRTTPRLVHALAREWLVADAAARGAWTRAAQLAWGQQARTRMTRLIGTAASYLAGMPPSPPVALLWLHWLLAPRRRHTLVLVRRAIQAARASAAAAPDTRQPLITSLQPDPHQDALRVHVLVLGIVLGDAPGNQAQAGPRQAELLRSLAEAWDAALTDPATHRRLAERAAALGARDGDAALRTLSEAVARDMADMARAASLPMADWAGGSQILGEAMRLVRDELMAELELAFDALHVRVAGNRRLSAVDEWREWLALRALYRRAEAIGGLELRRLAFPHVHQVACKYGVWLWNQYHQQLMANTIFRWLLDEALIVGDAEAIELQRRNWEERF